MTQNRDAGPEAIGQAALTLLQGLICLMQEKGILTGDDVIALYEEAARKQQSLLDDEGVVSLPNEMAAHILEELAKRFADRT